MDDQDQELFGADISLCKYPGPVKFHINYSYKTISPQKISLSFIFKSYVNRITKPVVYKEIWKHLLKACSINLKSHASLNG
jgi:hypothetical protein